MCFELGRLIKNLKKIMKNLISNDIIYSYPFTSYEDDSKFMVPRDKPWEIAAVEGYN